METDGARAISGLLDDLHRALLTGDLKTLVAIEARLEEVTPTATLTTADRRKLAARKTYARCCRQADADCAAPNVAWPRSSAFWRGRVSMIVAADWAPRWRKVRSSQSVSDLSQMPRIWVAYPLVP